MDAADYDVAIVGAGAYSLPLAAHARDAGHAAIQMSGATQLLFGIKGKRWDDHLSFPSSTILPGSVPTRPRASAIKKRSRAGATGNFSDNR